MPLNLQNKDLRSTAISIVNFYGELRLILIVWFYRKANGWKLDSCLHYQYTGWCCV